MPTLKQLTCHIEHSNTQVPLNEYGTTYGDGTVQSFVAVPVPASPSSVPIPVPFSIHLQSAGYIAPGLAMFVFIDGVYQCNRNRDDLAWDPAAVGKEIKGGNKKAKGTRGIDFRVRQKEEKREDGSWAGRPWRFEEFRLVNSIQDVTDDEARAHFAKLGEIEVVVLRCMPLAGQQNQRSEGSATPDSAMAPGFNAEDFDGLTGGDDIDQRSSAAVRFAAPFDGDTGEAYYGPYPYHQYYYPYANGPHAHRGWEQPPWQQYGTAPYQPWDNDQRPVQQPPPPPPPQPHPPLHYAPGYDYWNYMPAYNVPPAPAHPATSRAAQQSYCSKCGGLQQARKGPTHNRCKSCGQQNAETKAPPQHVTGYWVRQPPWPGPSQIPGRRGPPGYVPYNSQQGANGHPIVFNVNSQPYQDRVCQCPHVVDHGPYVISDGQRVYSGCEHCRHITEDKKDDQKGGKKGDNKGNNKGENKGENKKENKGENKGDKKDDSKDKNKENDDKKGKKKKQKKEKKDNNSGANDPWGSWNNGNNSDGGTDSSRESQKGNEGNENNDAWGNGGQSSDNQNDQEGNTGNWNSGDSWGNDQQNQGQQDSGDPFSKNANNNQSNPQNSWPQDNGNGTHQQRGQQDASHGPQWQQRSSQQLPQGAHQPINQQPRASYAPRAPANGIPQFVSPTHREPVTDEPPLYTVPESVANDNALTHQVQVGGSSSYSHKIRVPRYLDTMEEPYARFVFRYRQKDIIEKLFNVTVERSVEAERKILQSLSRDQLVDQLLRAQGFLGKSHQVQHPPGNAGQGPTSNSAHVNNIQSNWTNMTQPAAAVAPQQNQNGMANTPFHGQHTQQQNSNQLNPANLHAALDNLARGHDNSDNGPGGHTGQAAGDPFLGGGAAGGAGQSGDNGDPHANPPAADSDPFMNPGANSGGAGNFQDTSGGAEEALNTGGW